MAARKLRRAARVATGYSDAPRAPVLLPAGMMPEPPGRGPYPSARGRRARSAIREYPPERRPLKSEIGRGYRHRRGKVKGVRISVDESKHFGVRVWLVARGTRMIRAGTVWAAACFVTT